jgi:asparagine synthase (glutamine-hydrolysing)
MCSILAILDLKQDPAALRARAVALSRLQRHRGPDWSGIYTGGNAILAHERLAIVDVTHGAQPLLNQAGTHALAVNGEIYNHRELRPADYPFQTGSDCEVILALYRDHDVDFLDQLNGMFAFVLYDAERRRYIVARDHMGIVPLYMGQDSAGNTYVASEMKALVPACASVWEFPPGHFLDSETGRTTSYYKRAWRDFHVVERNHGGPELIREALTRAVERQLMSDVPYGVLLSGGLDSSIIAAIAKTFAARRVEEQGRTEAWWPQLHSFSVGLETSPDLKAAREVAKHIGSVHHEFHFTIQEGFDALSDVIHHLETYDVTSIRAATPMYLMARRIRAMGVKMVLSGEGADEIFGGYLYFHHAPSAEAFHAETIRKLDRLHWYDCLRANKAMAAWGVEARVPFLDKEFMDVAMSLAPAAKMAGPGRMEKHVLREAFAADLPASIAWRQKEQFSDGVGYDWIDMLRAHTSAEVSDQAMTNAHIRFPYNTPATKEAYFYRAIFHEHFAHDACARCVPGGASVACSTSEALGWDPALAAVIDPSGRAVRSVHQQAYHG